MSIRYATLPLSLVGAFALATAAHASFTETFTGGSNVGGWDWGFGNSIPGAGGNPGEYLDAEGLDTFGPILSTTIGVPSPFVGDLRAAGVTGMGVDLKVDHTDFPYGGEAFAVTLMLKNTHGNNDDWSDPDFNPLSDDDYAYVVGNLIPQPEDGWLHYDFAFDTSSNLPASWIAGSFDGPGSFRPGVTWDDLITHVDQVQFWTLQPDWFAIFQQWHIGADNISVTTAPVPEPATMAVLGFGALAVLRRRRK